MILKKIKAIVCGIVLLVCVDASAECGNLNLELTPFFGRLYFGGNTLRANYLAEPARGFLIGVAPVYQFDFPLMLQSGIDMSYLASHSKRLIAQKKVQCHDRFLTATIPVNVGLHMGNHGASIDPYVGFNMRFNMVAKSYADGYDKVDYFDERDAKRFVPGLNIGADINLFVFYIGYRYTKDFDNFIPNMKSHSTYHRVNIGLNIPL